MHEEPIHSPGPKAGLTPEYVVALRQMTGAQRLSVATRLWWSAWELKTARLHQLHPDWDQARIRDKVREFMRHAAS